MNALLRQLGRWRTRERLVRLVAGGARVLAVSAVVLAVACLADWLYDRYADVPLWLRLLATGGQLALAAGLAVWLVARPVAATPGVDDLAFRAERAIPSFGHRLVTALQLNRPGARTAGMSPALIAEVTREAGEMSARHRLTDLIDYRPVRVGLAVVLPVLLAWGAFAAVNPPLARVLLQRQALLGGDIPRSVALVNVTPEVWPAGAEVKLQYKVTGQWRDDMTGTARVTPDGQPADDYPLTFEKQEEDGSAVFAATLPPSSLPFHFRARLADGRTRSPGRVEFEPPPQVTGVEAWQLLPEYLGSRTADIDGQPVTVPYERYQPKGEVVNALPLSGVRVEATFNKPVARARLIPVERGDANAEVDGKPREPAEMAADRQSAGWTFPTTPRTVGYRIELADVRGFIGPAPARRGVKMLDDRPPEVVLQRESTRNPDPTNFHGQGAAELYEWDFPLAWKEAAQPGEGATGPIQVIYSTNSDLGIGRVNLRYRVIPRGEEVASVHPRDDPHGRVFARHTTARYTPPAGIGRFVPDLGLFEQSFAPEFRPRLKDKLLPTSRVMVEFYPLPSPNAAVEPGELAAGGRYNFDTDGLRKPGGDGTMHKLAVGDTVEVYVEVFDKYALFLEQLAAQKLTDEQRRALPPPRPAGYTREARRKIVVTEDDARALTRARDEKNKKLQDKLREIADDQRGVFQPGKK